MTIEREHELHRVLHQLLARLEDARDDDGAMRAFLRAARDFLGAAAAAIAIPDTGHDGARIVVDLGGTPWDLGPIAAFLRDERLRLPFHVLMFPVARRGRRWGAMVLRQHGQDFPRGSGRIVEAFATDLSRTLARIDGLRVHEIRARVDRKIMEQLRPRDLFYHVLDALRTVTRYDHSSSLLMTADGGATLEVVAEQVAWHKGRSRKIGLKRSLDAPLRALLQRGEVHGFRRDGEAWRPWNPGAGASLAELLDYNRDEGRAGASPRETTVLAAPIATGDGVIGLIKVAAVDPSLLQAYELSQVRQFVSPASVAIQYLLGTESLKARMLLAERKHAIADVARGVAHDVNNALGAMLPLVQQMQIDARVRVLDPAVLEADLAQIEESVRVCRRIFGAMLSFARDGGGRVGQANLRRATDATLAILKHSLENQRIAVEVRVPDTLPQIRCGQGDLEQLMLNLVTNARDAMPRGGRVVVRAEPRSGTIEVVIEDEGCGIPRENLARIFEPFFTTKPEGNGLGLSVCRSILWAMHGEMTIESPAGKGTRVTLTLPAADRESPERPR